VQADGLVSYQAMDLHLNVGLEPDAEPAEVYEATSQLQGELLSLDVDAVERPAGEPPPGTRVAEVPELATLVVSLGPSVITAIAQTLAGWVSRGGSRTVKLDLGGDSIEVAGVSSSDQRRLIESFLTTHGAGSHEHRT
jgi:hypothetical protein